VETLQVDSSGPSDLFLRLVDLVSSATPMSEPIAHYWVWRKLDVARGQVWKMFEMGAGDFAPVHCWHCVEQPRSQAQTHQYQYP
jgi:hypothetical protein